ncbi:hypothetical protein AN639_06190 [Candidatus Epulonipiscium fishelsonii]|uniref:Uncharacterized protein n=1 Tax=Candidatus Epulonipiscium fishelsonii TaxID=77094 RepID=A0ACC8X9I4_9FIRM|nr:hypothetical protein AN396_09755 [Epulopiscium sp. SCG-B11WGA-EpuloA1]ONI39336.1 hypothetical protein AN639_06190 [Epulopiscium sp. SCG-B05WGA-EpuloA1]
MKTTDLYKLSTTNLWRRKLRSGLTILGVVIGVASIIMMFSLSEAMNVNYENQMNQWGELSLITVTPADDMNGLVEIEPLDENTLEMFEMIANVEKVMPVLETEVTLQIGDYGTMRQLTVKGHDADELEALGYICEEGSNYFEGDINTMVIGGDVLDYLVKKGEDMSKTSSSSRGGMPSGGGGGRMPSGGGGGGMMPPSSMMSDMPSEMRERMEEIMGEKEDVVDIFTERAIVTFDTFSMRLPPGMESFMPKNDTASDYTAKPITVEITGQLPSGNASTDNVLFMPRESVQYLINQKTIQDAKTSGNSPDLSTIVEYDEVIIKVFSSNDVEMVRAQIEMMGFTTDGAQDTLDEMQQMSSNIQIILLFIGAISLVVSAIGITNTMMTSIYERTKEIGVMKVIGAGITDIKKIFLVEAAIIGFVGGIIGISLCYLLSFLLNTYGKEFFSGLVSTSEDYKTYVSIITPYLSIGSIVFSTIIGLMAGYFPAKKATALSALAAMKA